MRIAVDVMCMVVGCIYVIYCMTTYYPVSFVLKLFIFLQWKNCNTVSMENHKRNIFKIIFFLVTKLVIIE